MSQKIIIAEKIRIAAILKNDKVEELIVAKGSYQIGDVFLGTIENVLPGIDAAFVNIGSGEKNGFIHVSDLGPLRKKKTSAQITELLDPRQPVLVQVIKEPTGTKGPRLTGNLSLTGRYLILQPNGQGVNVSRKINLENERNRLKALGVLIKPPGTGLVIRAEAENTNEELLIDDLELLLTQWEKIQKDSASMTPPSLINRDNDFTQKVLRDHINLNISNIIIDTKNGVEKAKSFLGKENNNISINYHDESSNLLDYYKIYNAISNAIKPRVDLPSGGYIVIEPTEALTVIDVNSGSSNMSANSKETVLWTNCEAAVEIARQLKLRNIGGVIVIDFIDMESRRDQLQLLEYFTSAIKDDSSRPQIAQLTELGLVELTRKRQGQNIYELFGKSCSECNGIGYHINIETKEEDINQNTFPINTTKDNNLNIEYQLVNPLKDDRSRNDINEIGSIQDGSYQKDEGRNIDSSSIKKNKELISVEIDPEEEIVFSHLGINPILLLKEKPDSNNIVVQISTADKNKLTLDEDKKIINGKDIIEEKNNLLDQKITENKISDIQDDQTPQINNLNTVKLDSSEDQKLKSQDPNEENDLDDSRRRRRRSSASK